MRRVIKTYSELIRLPTYEERLAYLKIGGMVGIETFGFDRYLNQAFYRSSEWKRVRNMIFVRDNGCDLACDDRPIYDHYIVHHINPLTIDDINEASDFLFNPEYLITTDPDTHNTIHYGVERKTPSPFVDRKPNDTCPWRKSM